MSHQRILYLLEIGCGTGYVLTGINQSFPDRKLCGSEIFTAELSYCAERLPSANLMQMDARNIPFNIEFDVLESIEDDELVIKQIHTSLKSNGLMIITVPRHDWLWSPTDVHACHVKRYSSKDLHSKIKLAGFEAIRSSSFVSFLLRAMVISRLYQQKVFSKKHDATSELKVASLINHIFFNILKTEQFLIRKEINFPIGGSRLIVASKR